MAKKSPKLVPQSRGSSTTDEFNARKKIRTNYNFIEHCKANNLEGVTDCLSRGVDVNTVSEDGRWSGLTIAAYKNYPELLEILISHPDIKINKTSGEYQWTALMVACNAGSSAIVDRLVQVPWLDFNYKNEEGETAALLASYDL